MSGRLMLVGRPTEILDFMNKLLGNHLWGQQAVFLIAG